MSAQKSKEWKQAEAAFAKQQAQPISPRGTNPTVSLAEENIARQKAERLARDAAKATTRKR